MTGRGLPAGDSSQYWYAMDLNFLRRNRLAVSAFRSWNNLLHGKGAGGFHRDAMYRGVMLELLKAFPFTSFVETGTYHGYSTELVAIHHPNLPIFTSEVVENTYYIARAALKKYPNIHQTLGSSNEFIEKLVKDPAIGAFPLFFLDAHWYKYWPLRDELRHIGNAKLKCVIVIDDFEVPGQPQFEFDVDGGAKQGAGENCNLGYIQPALVPGNTFHCIFPKYNRLDAFGASSNPKRDRLRGHPVIFQNAAAEYEAFLKRPFVQQHYFAHGALTPNHELAA
jgi:hypothetical protein